MTRTTAPVLSLLTVVLLLICHTAIAAQSTEELIAERKYEAVLDRLRAKATSLEKNGADCREVFDALCGAYAAIKRLAKTDAIYQELRRKYELRSGRSAGVGRYYARGGAYRYAGKFDDAIRCYKLAENQSHPNRYLAMLNGALCHFCKGDTAAARKIAQDMVDKKTSWHERAKKLLKALDYADRGDVLGYLQAGQWLLDDSGGAHYRLPYGAALYFEKALKLPTASPEQRTLIRKRLQEARMLTRPLTSHSSYPPRQPYRDKVADFPGPCAKGHDLEKQGKLTEALKAYRGFRSVSTCGLGAIHDDAGNAADTARVLGKLGDLKGAASMWKKALQYGGSTSVSMVDSRNAYQLVLSTKAVNGLRAEILKIFPDKSPVRKRILDIESLQEATRKKDPKRVFSLSDRLPPEFLVHALLTIGKSSVPEVINHLPQQNLYSYWHDHPEERNKMRTAVIAIGALKDPRGVRPLCKAAAHMSVFLAHKSWEALASLEGSFREELTPWLDSDDPAELAAAIRYLFRPGILQAPLNDKVRGQ